MSHEMTTPRGWERMRHGQHTFLVPAKAYEEITKLLFISVSYYILSYFFCVLRNS